MMAEDWLSHKLRVLEERQKSLLQEFDKAHQQWKVALSAVEQEKLQRQINDLDSKLEKAQEDITETAEKIRRLPTSQSGNAQPSSAGQVTVQLGVVAMRRDQVEELLSQSVVDDPAVATARIEFGKLCTLLSAYGVENLASNYGEDPDSWKPPLADGSVTVIDAIEHVLDKITQTHSVLPGHPPIVLRSISHDFLSDEAVQRAAARELLEDQGGVIVVDALSLYHPIVHKRLVDSQVFGLHTPIALVVLSPLRADKIPVYQMLHGQVYRTYLERAFEFFVERLDPFYEFNVNDLCSLRRWLFSVLPDSRRRAMSSEARAEAIATAGHPAAGIVDFVSGRPRA